MAETESSSATKEETNDLLALYDDMFKTRYTDDDADYAKTVQRADEPPPCVENWYSRPKRSFDWTRGQKPDYKYDDKNHHRHGNRDDHRGHGDYRNRHSGGGSSRDRYQPYDRQRQDYDRRADGRHNEYADPRSKYNRSNQGREVSHH